MGRASYSTRSGNATPDANAVLQTWSYTRSVAYGQIGFTSRNIHLLALSSALMFSLTVAGVIIAVTVDPDGGITGGLASLMAFPWSLVVLRLASRDPIIAAANLFFGFINAAILYIVIRLLGKVASFRAAFVAVVFCCFSSVALLCFFNSQFRDYDVRIVGAGGSWIATDQDGLNAMSYTLGTPSGARSDSRSHVLLLSEKTRGIFKGRYYLLRGGRLVAPYATTLSDMQRDGVIEIERIKITDGPLRGLEGWVPTKCLRRRLTIFAL